MTGMQPTGAWEPYVVVKPGGLSSTARTVHTVLLLLSCGWWGPIFFLAYLTAPIKRVDVVAPPGTDPRVVESMRQTALAERTEADLDAANVRKLGAAAAGACGLVVGIAVAWFVCG